MPINLRALLEEMIEKDASDLHLVAGERPKLRVDGDIVSATSEDVMTPISLACRATGIDLMVRVRKNANNLTTAERDRFCSAFATLNDRGAMVRINDLVADVKQH